MPALALKLTDAGLAAVQAASGSDPTSIVQLGLTATHFDYAPTLSALPGEFKRLAVESGVSVADNVTHLTAYDTSAEVWSATGLGLYLEDGTLFAVSTGDQPVMTKAALAFALFAFDIAFLSDLAANIVYGNAVFAYPPASETTRGVARLATQARVNAADDGEDDAQTIVTPRTLRARLAALVASVTASFNTAIGAEATARGNGDAALNAAIGAEATARGNADSTLQGNITALQARTVTGGGLVSGGGDLSANRTLTVAEASAADITAGTAPDKVVTPRRLGPVTMLLEQNGFIRFFGFQIAWGRFIATANTTTPVVFAQPFETSCFSAVVSGVINGGAGSQDNTPAVIVSTITKAGFSVFSADDENDPTCYIAVGT